jgi:hypothetical protein
MIDRRSAGDRWGRLRAAVPDDLAPQLQALAHQVGELEADRAACRDALRQIAFAAGVVRGSSLDQIVAAVVDVLKSPDRMPVAWRVDGPAGALVLRHRFVATQAVRLIPANTSKPMVCEVCQETIPAARPCWRAAAAPHGEHPLPKRDVRVCEGCVAALHGRIT